MQNAYAIVEVAFKGNIIEKKNIHLNNEIKTFSIPIKDAYKGGLEVNYVIVNKNRSYTGSQYIAVPYEDKSLKIEWITFRDKLLPNAKEQWKLKISGNNKEKIASELLATMYDASLDAFLPHSLDFGLSQSYYNGYLGSYGSDGFGIKSSNLYTSKDWNPYKEYASHSYDDLNLFGLRLGGFRRNMFYSLKAKVAGVMVSENAPAPEMLADGMAMEEKEAGFANKKIEDKFVDFGNRGTIEYTDSNLIPIQQPKKPEVTPRTNLNETAFFLPQLQTDAEGNVILNFQMPEALTKWNFLGLAHTKDLHYQYFTKSVVTQKELMVTPNAPRFLREGDKLEFTTKISNYQIKICLEKQN
mgnify:FL=1